MRFVARVRALVDGERRALNEGLVAIGIVASIRPLVGMDAKMSLQVRLAIEALLLSSCSPRRLLPLNNPYANRKGKVASACPLAR